MEEQRGGSNKRDRQRGRVMIDMNREEESRRDGKKEEQRGREWK